MAILFADTPCALCGRVLDAPYIATSGCAFAEGHRLWRYCDAPLHVACVETWREREEFARGYYDLELSSHREGYGRVLATATDWFAACGPAATGEVPYFAAVRLRDWPLRLYTRYLEWDRFLAGEYRADVALGALVRADEIMAEVRRVLPTQESVDRARLTRATRASERGRRTRR